MATTPPPAPRAHRPFPWKLAGLAALSVALLWGAAELGIRWLAERRWAAMKLKWHALLEEARARGVNRPPLRPEPLEGNAWDDYALALREIRTLYEVESQAAPGYLREESPEARNLVARVLARHPVILDSVRRGARRTNANLALEWKEGALAMPSRHGTATIAGLAVCQSRFLVEAGRRREAVELLLDACRFTGDLDHPEDMAPELEELADLVRSDKLSGPDLEQLDRELEILDQGFPRRSHRMALDFLSLSSLFITSGGSITPQIVGFGADPDASLWRFGYSGRLMKTDAFDSIERAVKQLADGDLGTWTESHGLVTRIADELRLSPNPISQAAGEELLASDLPHRGHRAQLRLLRVAAHFRATGRVLELPDPFGGMLATRRSGDSLCVWSTGGECRDHGGCGSFKFDAQDRAPRDIVLEIRPGP